MYKLSTLVNVQYFKFSNFMTFLHMSTGLIIFKGNGKKEREYILDRFRETGARYGLKEK